MALDLLHRGHIKLPGSRLAVAMLFPPTFRASSQEYHENLCSQTSRLCWPSHLHRRHNGLAAWHLVGWTKIPYASSRTHSEVTSLTPSSLAISASHSYHCLWCSHDRTLTSMGYVASVGRFSPYVTDWLLEHFGKPRHPLIPLYLFKNRNYICFTVLGTVVSMIYYGVSIIYPQQIATLFGKSATATGWIGVSCRHRPRLRDFIIIANSAP